MSALARPFQIARKRKNENKRLTGVSTLVLFVRGLAKGRSASNWTVAREAELRVVAAALQKYGGDLAAVLVAVDAVITGTELPALFLFYGFNVTGAARRRARPVRVPLPKNSAGLHRAPRVRGLGGFTLVWGYFGEVRKRNSSSTLHVSERRKG